jgi:hypothetical protein
LLTLSLPIGPLTLITDPQHQPDRFDRRFD